MKKYLLSLLVLGLTFVGFSNAQFTTDSYVTKSETLTNYGKINISDSGITYRVTCPSGGCGPLQIQGSLAYENFWSYYTLDCSNGCIMDLSDTSMKYRFYCYGNSCSFNYSFPGKVEYLPVSSLSPVIVGVKDTTFQLIPLVVYIGIGVLIVTLGFFAIRWLVNWIVGKINSNFSSKRG